MVEDDSHITDLADAGISTKAGHTRLDSGIAKDAFLRSAGIPIEIDLLIGAARDTISPSPALLLVNQNNSVFISLIESS
jgi:hypothetical protein